MELDDTLENYIRKTVDFHGCFQKAPGVIIGCYMVEYAMELMGNFQGRLNAVVETRVCLSDCVQVMTGCTLGNKALWLKDDLGRYAFSLYDRDTKHGVRVFLDVNKISKDLYPDLWAFHMRQRDPKVLTDMDFRKQSGDKVVQQFLKIKRDCLSHHRVKINLPTKGIIYPSIQCQKCSEPYLKTDPRAPDLCLACGGDGRYYDVPEAGSVPKDAVRAEEPVASCRGM